MFFFILFLGAYFFLVCAVRAENQPNNGESIYFCTKDLDVLHSVAIENPANNDTEKGRYCAANNFDSAILKKFRHCFLMLARKVKGNGHFYYLETDQALFGYGSEDSGSSATSKRGKARAETLVPGTAMACVPVLNQGDIHGNNLLDTDGKERNMFYWWTVVQNYMDADATENSYDTYTHNCCTVASNAIKKVGGHLEKINFASFNEGYGIIDKEGMSLLKFIGLSAAVSWEFGKGSSNKVSRFLFKSDSILGSEICNDNNHDATDGVEEKEKSEL